MSIESKTIAVDFDGTTVSDAFPDVGFEIGAEAVLRDLAAAGRKIIIWTVRSDATLAPVLEWYKQRKIKYYAVNRNPDQAEFSTSGKVIAHAYIDDRSIGCPKIKLPGIDKPAVDWIKVRAYLVAEGYLQR